MLQDKSYFAHRKYLLRNSIRKQQIEEQMKKKRSIFSPHLNPCQEIWEIKYNIRYFNIKYFTPEIHQTLIFIFSNICDNEFCYRIQQSYLLEDLIVLVFQQLFLYKETESKVCNIVKNLLRLIIQLMPMSDNIRNSTVKYLHVIQYSLYKFPAEIEILDSIVHIYSFYQNFDEKYLKKEKASRKMSKQEQEFIISSLLSEYVQIKPQRNENIQILNQQITQKNKKLDSVQALFTATNALFICNVILHERDDRVFVVKKTRLFSYIKEILQTFVKRFSSYFVRFQHFQENQQNSQQSNETNCESQTQVFNAYIQFIIQIIKVLTFCEFIDYQVLSLLNNSLLIIIKNPFFNTTSSELAKNLMKILYQQMILTYEQIQTFCAQHSQISIQSIVGNDFI